MVQDCQVAMDRGHGAFSLLAPADEASLPVLAAMLEADPAQPGLWAEYGEALAREGDALPAVAAFARAIEYAPRVAALHHRLADALEAVGSRHAAADARARAAALRPAA